MKAAKLVLAIACALSVTAGGAVHAQAPRADFGRELRRAQGAAKKGELEAADAIYARLLEVRPGDHEVLVGRSWVSLKRGDFKRAATLASSVLECEPRHAKASALLGLAFLRSGMVRPAFAVLTDALEVDSGEPLAIGGMAEIRMFANDMAGALRLARRAVSIAPRDPDALFLLGQTAARQESFEEAAIAYDMFLEVAPRLDAERRDKIRGLIDLYHRLGDVRLYLVRGERSADISFLLSDKMVPMVEVAVNGRRGMRFMIDTGSGFTVISDEAAAKLKVRKLAAGGMTQGVGGGGKFPIVYGLINEINFGDIKIQNVPTYIRKFHYDSRERIDGFIGLSLLSRFLAAIDYQARRLELRPPQSPSNPLGPSDFEIPYSVTTGGMLSVTTDVSDAAGQLNFIVDTGASSTVVSREAFDALLNKPELDTRVSVSVVGAAGITHDVPVVVLKRLAVRGLEQKFVRALVLDLDTLNESSGFRQFGILGGNFLRHFRLEIDFVRGVITFRPYAVHASRGAGLPAEAPRL
jgi:predicted aspartyl protease/Flp pilus assembly protein TadD